MVIQLDFSSNQPIYDQICQQIRLGIGTGALPQGESLPTVRQLAEDLGINPMTVNKAYGQLKSEGWIEIDRRQGAMIKTDVVKIKALVEPHRLKEETLNFALSVIMASIPTEVAMEQLREALKLLEVLEQLVKEGRP